MEVWGSNPHSCARTENKDIQKRNLKLVARRVSKFSIDAYV